MAQNRGKQFESRLKEDFSKLPGAFIYRVPDNMSGYRGITGICDFIGFKKPKIFFLEAKTILGNTFPLTNFTQFDKLMSIPNHDGIHRGVIIWFQTHDVVVYVPLKTFIKLKEDGKKSFNVKYVESKEYDCIVIPSVKKRVFLDSDYSVLLDLPDVDW